LFYDDEFGEITQNKGQTPNSAKFRHAQTKSVRDIRRKKFCSQEKNVKVHLRSPDLSPIDRPYTSFYQHPGVTLALDCNSF